MKRAGGGLSALALLMLAACGGGGGGGSSAGANNPPPVTQPTPGGLFVKPAQESLSTSDVTAVVARAVAEAQARSRPATIAVVDRVGNVLAVYRMTGAGTTVRIDGVTGRGLQGIKLNGQDVIPDTLAAIAKALTGAYLSSSGNAFSSRTASEIVQTPFPPAPTAFGLESGPLYGVQFSQLPCSDLNTRFNSNLAAADAFIGPKRSPLGFAGDPGGFPLYKNGVVVGGVGVISDGLYSLDTDITAADANLDDEAIALAGTRGLDAPVDIRADRITVDGTSLIYSDAGTADLKSPGTATAIPSGSGGLVAVTGYFAGSIIAGTPYGTEASGIRPVTTAEFNNTDAYLLTNGAGAARFPVRAGTETGGLTATESRAILEQAFAVLSRARAQIRRPLDSRMQATISLVDTNGVVLGQVRSPDAPIFGIDVSLQKARTAMFFSGPFAAQQLQNAAPPVTPPFTAAFAPQSQIAGYVTRSQSFFGDPNAFTGRYAFSTRAIGNISRNRFPDGQLNVDPGPLAPANSAGDKFVAFNTGVQLDVVIDNIIQHVAYVLGASATDTPQACTYLPNSPAGTKRVANGFQIFSGGIPVYRGNTLVGAVGVSGDGIDQDDMVAFLGGASNGTAAAGNSLQNAPTAIRADQILVTVGSTAIRLRYVNCPFNPFLDSSEQNVCQGK